MTNNKELENLILSEYSFLMCLYKDDGIDSTGGLKAIFTAYQCYIDKLKDELADLKKQQNNKNSSTHKNIGWLLYMGIIVKNNKYYARFQVNGERHFYLCNGAKTKQEAKQIENTFKYKVMQIQGGY